ncbi:hypothetical protein [Streptomyces sp. NPDC015125]|uniref:hypothetical protein n=1 Tax=Streptomyces sp. NPDC015125 TaxID=3364938 RepID=UPI0036FC8A58
MTEQSTADRLVTAEACPCRFAPVSAWCIACAHDGMHRPGECTGIDSKQTEGAR